MHANCGKCPVEDLCAKTKGITFKEITAIWRRQYLTKSLGLISCTKRKRRYPCRASDMYQASDLFRKAYSYASKNYDLVAILSAKYGLLFPDDMIEPYDLTLNNMKSQQRKEWAEKVFNQMQNRLKLEDCKVFFHAGKKYREHLIPELRKIGIQCTVPLKNLSIGKQLTWYKEKG